MEPFDRLSSKWLPVEWDDGPELDLDQLEPAEPRCSPVPHKCTCGRQTSPVPAPPTFDQLLEEFEDDVVQRAEALVRAHDRACREGNVLPPKLGIIPGLAARRNDGTVRYLHLENITSYSAADVTELAQRENLHLTKIHVSEILDTDV